MGSSKRILFQIFFTFFVVSSVNVAADDGDVCVLAKDKGRCRALKPYFYFNTEHNRCETFFFGGCGGNGNKFKTLKDCHETCKSHLSDTNDVSVHFRSSHCTLSPISNPLRSCYAFFQRFTFNPISLSCEPYIYGGCGATANLYLSEDECKASCLYGDQLPSLPRRSGTAQTAARAAPVSFARSLPGRGPAENQIGSEVEAAPVPEEETNICNLPPMNPSPIQCTGFMRKWTYDSKIGTCVEYIYGGCFGTKNLFNSKEECEAKCSTSTHVEERKTSDVCAKPIDKGPCRGLKFKFAFNKDTNRCEKFAYGGCQGNANRFDSLEGCVNLCGGFEPQEKLDCSAAVCNKQDAAFHRSKGCQPIVKEGECCPSSWDCSAWEERLRQPDKCFWANEDHPRGKYFDKLERVPEASDSGSCRMACVCVEGFGSGAEIICATPGCYWPGLQGKGANCKMLYKDLNSCCATHVKCDEELDDLHKCTMDNTTYVAGQKMFPKDDPCKVCICNEGWSGETDDKEFCVNVDCGLNYQSSAKLKQGCHPIYKEGVCCPVSWVCPVPKVSVDPFPEEEAPPSSSKMVICPPGVNIREGVNLDPPVPSKEPLGSSSLVEVRPDPARNPSDVCLLPKTLGPCDGFEEAWFFDIDSRKCHKFKTGGPGSGGNLFETEEECKETCKQFALESTSSGCKFSVGGDDEDPEFVAQPLIMCLTEHKRFRFNKNSGKCEEYVDWTCGLRNNGYSSMDECEANCLPHDHASDEEEREMIKGKEEKCNLQAKTGPCKSRMRRFFYDSHVGKCKLFYYGGCQSNGNNFLDERDCIETCVNEDQLARALQPQDLDVHSPCKQKGAVAGPCRAHRPRFYFDAEKKICRIFFYGGCGGNDNNFANLKDCSAMCAIDEDAQKNHLQICELPKQVDNCEKHERRFFYNPETFICEAFDYTGCGGNEGNFKTLADCQLECVLPRTMKTLEGHTQRSSIEARTALLTNDDDDAEANHVTTNDPCLRDQFVGMCRAAIRRFFFDKETKQCKKFIYGGCGGNDNNFASLTDCENKCSHHFSKERSLKPEKSKFRSKNLPTNPLCLLPVEVGPCEALIPGFFFNTQTKRCEAFVYGGCRGNGNRFSTRDECESTCALPSQSGEGLTPVLPQITRKCHLGDEQFNIGDLLRYGNNRCRTCQCLTPPGLTCIEKICKPIKLIKTGNSECEPTYDEDSCCEIGYKCRPKTEDENTGECAERTCAIFDFRTPEGQTCTSLSDGCCQAGIMCVPKN